MKIIRNKNSQIDPNKFYVIWGSQGHVGFYSEPYNSESDAYAAIDAAGASEVRRGVGPEDDYLTVMKGSQVKPPMGMPPQKVESIVSNWNGFVREYNSRKSNSTHKFTGSLELTDDEKSEVNETIKEFWDDSKPMESYIKVLNYFIKNWGINVKDIPTNQFKTLEDLMDWEEKNFGHVPSLIGNIENYIATELTDYVDQLPSQYNSRKSNSMLPQADTKVVDLYVAKANDDNYLDILRDIAKELNEHFDVRKEFETPNEFRAWAEKNDKISDRMYIIIDYVLGGVTGMKKGERQKSSRQSNSDVICAEVWGTKGMKSVEDYYILGEDEIEERIESLRNYDSAPDEMKFLSFNTFELSDSGYGKFLDFLKKYGNCAPNETIGSLKKLLEGRKPLSLNSRQVNNVAASVDIDLKRGFTVGDLTVKVEGDTIIIHAEDPNGNHANEFLRTKDPIYAIKTILSRASNWVGSKQNSRQVNADLSTKISQINEKIAEKGYKANWDSENDQIEIKGKDSDIVTLIQEGDKIILSRWDEVVYIATDFDKVLKELVNQLGKN